MKQFIQYSSMKANRFLIVLLMSVMAGQVWGAYIELTTTALGLSGTSYTSNSTGVDVGGVTIKFADLNVTNGINFRGASSATLWNSSAMPQNIDSVVLTDVGYSGDNPDNIEVYGSTSAKGTTTKIYNGTGTGKIKVVFTSYSYKYFYIKRAGSSRTAYTSSIRVYYTIPPRTVSFSTGDGNDALDDRTEEVGGEGITLPSRTDLTPACSSAGWYLWGWATAEYDESSSAPTSTLVGKAGTTYIPSSDVTLYAVYKKGEAAVGENILVENFTGFASGSAPSAPNGNTVVYDGAPLTYTCTNGGSDTKIYLETNAGGTSPELLVGKNTGSFKIEGIPSGGATTLTLSYKRNNKALTPSIEGTDYSLGSISGSNPYTHTITVGSDETFDLTFTPGTDNVRLDNISIVVATTSTSVLYNSNPDCTYDYFVDIMHDNEISPRQKTYSMPSVTDEESNSYCEGEHYHFLGWVEEDDINDDGTLKSGYTLYPAGDSGHTAANKTYYAIWAKEE